MVVSRLWLDLAETQRSWDVFVQPLINAYHCQICRYTNVFSFLLMLLQRPAGPSTSYSSTILHTDALTETTPRALGDHFLPYLTRMSSEASRTLLEIQSRSKKYLDHTIWTMTEFWTWRFFYVDHLPLVTFFRERISDKYNRFLSQAYGSIRFQRITEYLGALEEDGISNINSIDGATPVADGVEYQGRSKTPTYLEGQEYRRWYDQRLRRGSL